MSESCAIVVMGVSGRMGRMLVQTVQDNPKTQLSGAVERPGHDWIGRELGEEPEMVESRRSLMLDTHEESEPGGES